MVPWYQMMVDLMVAAALVLAAVYAPMMLGRRLSRWAEIGMTTVGLVLVAGVLFASMSGHWPFRG